MTYKLKTTGIAQYARHLLAIEPDTLTYKDFGTVSVKPTIAVDPDITLVDVAWKSTTAKALQLSTGNFVAFSGTRPRVLCSSNGQRRTVIYVAQMGGREGIVMGPDSSNYFGQKTLSGGYTTYPAAGPGGHAAQTSPNTGDKVIYAVTYDRAASFSTVTMWWANESGTTVSTATASASPTPNTIDWNLDYLHRLGSSATQSPDKSILVAVLEHDAVAMTAAMIEEVLADPIGAFLEIESGGYTLTAAHGTYALTGQSVDFELAGRLAAAAGSYLLTGQAAGLWRGRRLSAAHGVYALTGQAADLVHTIPGGTLTTKPFKLNNGSLRTGLSGLKVAVLNLADLSAAALFASQVTDGSGVLAVTDADIDPGTPYGVVVADAAGTTIGVDIITAT